MARYGKEGGGRMASLNPDCGVEGMKSSPSFEEVVRLEKTWIESGGKEEPKSLVRALCARYPFLAFRNAAPEEAHRRDATASWTWLSMMPVGWRRVIGVYLAEDVRTLPVASGCPDSLFNYRVVDVKEKYGGLRWYAEMPVGIGKAFASYLERVAELYGALCERICIHCGSMTGVCQTRGWILPICECEEGYERARELPKIMRDKPFCVWTSYEKDGTQRRESYKDLCVGNDAPVVQDLRLGSALHVTEVWNRLCSVGE